MPNYSELARQHGMSQSLLWTRVNRDGWSLDRALKTPARKAVNKGIAEIARKYGIPLGTLSSRMSTGDYATLEDAAKPARQSHTGETFEGVPCKICGNTTRYKSCKICTLTQHHDVLTHT